MMGASAERSSKNHRGAGSASHNNITSSELGLIEFKFTMFGDHEVTRLDVHGAIRIGCLARCQTGMTGRSQQ